MASESVLPLCVLLTYLHLSTCLGDSLYMCNAIYHFRHDVQLIHALFVHLSWLTQQLTCQPRHLAHHSTADCSLTVAIWKAEGVQW